ncbi:MAG: hypothetical protein ACPL0C_05455 [Candidatus Bathyarchaeales archaeon]
MSEQELKEIDERSLPFFYKLILKIPKADFLESASGIFWSIVIPIFLVLFSFLTLFLLLFFPFPTNIILVSTIPTTVLIIFLRISLERFIKWWNLNIKEGSFEWNVEKTMQEYLELMKKEEKE